MWSYPVKNAVSYRHCSHFLFCRIFHQQPEVFSTQSLVDAQASDSPNTCGVNFLVDGGGDFDQSSMPKKKKDKSDSPREVGEEIKIAVNIAVKEFRHDESRTGKFGKRKFYLLS